jgi:hypothetical protein
MPNSQIDMVVQDGDKWKVCGDFERPENQPDLDVYLYVVVRQGDFVVGQPAIATAVAIAEEDPSGLESFTWAQQVDVRGGRTAGDPEPEFGPPETVAGHGELAAGHSISSSLTLKQGGAAAGDGPLVWEHELQIR